MYRHCFESFYSWWDWIFCQYSNTQYNAWEIVIVISCLSAQIRHKFQELAYSVVLSQNKIERQVKSDLFPLQDLRVRLADSQKATMDGVQNWDRVRDGEEDEWG